jgi:2-dehydro-3-deoxygalactonokinase
MTALIGLDWGTTNARAIRFDRGGAVAELRERPLGILRVPDGDFAGALAALTGDWRAATPGVPVLMCGMIGSRQGWREASYARLPADAQALAAALLALPEHGAWIVPGVAGDSLAGAPDVIRGEETQALGALDVLGRGNACLCMPGSHSKWVEMRDGRLVRFATFMTGEAFAALGGHTILARMIEQGPHDEAAFSAGLARAAAFPGTDVVLVGSEALAAPYRTALAAAGRVARIVPGDKAVAAGLWRLAEAARLVS